MSSFRWALVDIETTGLHVTRDEIIEIAVIILGNSGVEQTWHRLIKPIRSIPAAITSLTGISREMVANAPLFEEVACELLKILHNSIFVAHNARFDYGFIKNAFKKAGLSYQSSVLCTIKLFKQLYPGFTHYNLSYIARSFGLKEINQHRAESDVHTLHQIIEQSAARHSWDVVLKHAKSIYKKSSIPSKLVTDITQLPDSPGVYLFYGETNELPLYIGKSISLRQRVLSHFSGDHLHAREFTLSQQIVRVEVIPTAGELSALLLESGLIKKNLPIYNRKLRRKTTLTGYKLVDYKGYFRVSIVREMVDEDEGYNVHGIFGAFRSIRAAKDMLLQLVKIYGLCPKLCGMEQGNGPCFSYQLKKCSGACIGEESFETYNIRLMAAMEEYKEKEWPYKGAIAIKEYCPVNNITEFLVIDQWRYLGSVADEHRLQQWYDWVNVTIPCNHSFDAYRIIHSYLNNVVSKETIFELNAKKANL